MIILMLALERRAAIRHLSAVIRKHTQDRNLKDRRRRKNIRRLAQEYKYTNETRIGLFTTSLMLLVLTIGMVFAADQSPLGLGSGSGFETMAMILGLGAFLTYISSNAKKPGRKLTTSQKRSVRKNYRKLFSNEGLVAMYAKLRKMVAKADLTGVDIKKPGTVFHFIQHFLGSKYPGMKKYISQAISLVKHANHL